jgi:hypothetical protein
MKKLQRLVLICSVLLCAGPALAASPEKDGRFSDEDYFNDSMLDGTSYREFLERCEANKTFCTRSINFITHKYSSGRLACAYKPNDLQTVSMAVVFLMKAMLDKNPALAKQSGDDLRGAVIGSLDYLGKTCAERLKNAGG